MRPLITKPHLFISYSRKNGEVADYLYRFLSAAGFTVYYDKEKTLVGERFAVQIVKELKRSDAVVAIVSFASAQSSLGTIGWRISPLHPQLRLKAYLSIVINHVHPVN